MHRPSLLAATAVLGALTLPSVASAATFTVDPGAAPGCNGDRVCKEIGSALKDARLSSGDTVLVKKGTYSEPTLAVAKENVVLQAETPGTVVFSGTAAAGEPAITLAATGTQLKGFIAGTPVDGGPVVRVTAPGTTIDTSVIAKLQATATDAPAIEVVDSTVDGGTTTISSSYVINAPQTGEQSAPAINGTPDSSISLLGSIVLSGSNQGPALTLPGGDTAGGQPVANKVVRSSLFGGKQGANGIEAVTTGTRAKALVLDSSIVAPGQNGAALFVTTPDDGGGLGGQTPAGSVSITGTHVTLAGAGKAFDLRGVNSAGTVTASFARSIVRGTVASTVANYEGGDLVLGLPPSQTAATKSGATITDSDTNQTPKTGDAFITVSGGSNTPDEQLFVSPATRDLHLRPDAPVIDKGGPLVAGEADKDVDGEPRLNLAATDLGADEFVNKPPLVRIASNKDESLQGEPVTFAAEAADPEGAVGGGLARYVWDFGDGAVLETTEPVTSHTYTAVGPKEAKVTVFDKGGAQTTSAAKTITVKDGIGPVVTLTSPRNARSYRLYKVTKKKVTLRRGGKVVRDSKGRARTRTVTRRKAQKIPVKGTAVDDSGVAKVEVSIRRVGTSTSTCTYADGKGKFLSRSCQKPVYFPVRFREGAFAYNLKATSRVRKGKYEVSVRGVDAGNVTGAPAVATITLK